MWLNNHSRNLLMADRLTAFFRVFTKLNCPTFYPRSLYLNREDHVDICLCLAKKIIYLKKKVLRNAISDILRPSECFNVLIKISQSYAKTIENYVFGLKFAFRNQSEIMLQIMLFSILCFIKYGFNKKHYSPVFSRKKLKFRQWH